MFTKKRNRLFVTVISLILCMVLAFGAVGCVGGGKRERVTGITLNKTQLVMEENEVAALIATVRPTNATNKNVTWLSTDEDIVSVSKFGILTAGKKGTCSVIVSTEDGGFEAICYVRVNAKSTPPVVDPTKVQSVAIDPSSVVLKMNQSQQLVATVSPATATNKNVEWSSTDEAVAYVDDNGLVTAGNEGLCSIKVTTKDGNHEAFCTVYVTSQIASSFVVDFVTGSESEIPYQIVKEGDTVTKPADPTKSATAEYTYTFAGWTLNGADYDFDAPVTQNITLVAGWTATPITPVDPDPDTPVDPDPDQPGEGGGTDDPTDDAIEDTRNLTPQQYAFANLAGEDDYGRKITVRNPADPSNIYVGVFYSVWLGTHFRRELANEDIYDVNKLEKLGDDSPLYVNKFYEENPDSPANEYHFASEPLYGYYSMKDPWILNRHIELLTMSGIDYLMLDNTNAVVYTDATDLLLATLLKYYKQGWDVPKVSFYTNAVCRSTVQQIYNRYFNKDETTYNEEYEDLWLRFEGDSRPVIVGMSDKNKGSSDLFQSHAAHIINSNSDLYKFFNFFESQWPNCTPNDELGLPWMASWGNAPMPNLNGNIATSVIQHDNGVYASSKTGCGSRGYYGQGTTVDGLNINPDWRKNDNLEGQLNSARKWIGTNIEIKNIIVTGWNEWIAVKNPVGSPAHPVQGQLSSTVDQYTQKNVFFVDTYNAEFSRDMEMGKEYGDTPYKQLLRHAREVKFGAGVKYIMETATISDITNLTLWDNVKTEYADFIGDAMARDGENASGYDHAYIDNSNRNDIVSIKVVNDGINVYFLITTNEDITAHTAGDLGWMNLMISTGSTTNNKFMGYDYIINRTPNASGKTSIERCTTANTYAWENVGEADYFVSGKQMVVKIPVDALGIDASDISFSFKVTDNVTAPEDAMSYYIYGDCAPIGTIGYAYNIA